MFKNLYTKVVLVTVIICLFISSSTVVAQGYLVPMFSHISSFVLGFDIESDGTVLADATIYQFSGDSCKAKIYIQEYDNGWKTVASSSSNGIYNAITGTDYQARKGYMYRSVGYGYVYENGSMVESTVEYGRSEYY